VRQLGAGLFLLPFLLEEEDRAASFLVVRDADFLVAAEEGRAAGLFAVVEAGFLAAAFVCVPPDFLLARLAGALVAVELGAGAEAASIPAKTADKTIGRASLITGQLQASTSALEGRGAWRGSSPAAA
jgi:hypothetical protein